MSTTQKTTKRWPTNTSLAATHLSFQTRSRSEIAVKFAAPPASQASNTEDWLALRPEWAEREYREAYAQEAISQGIAWQIKVNRKRRGMSQAALAQALQTKQSAVSRMEDPDYGSQNLETLAKVARVFDCALLVKLVPYSVLAKESEHLSEDDLYAAPYSIESTGDQ